ncbi:MAG: hypothetical protein IJY42_00420, partial [Clostridia bacterium]|nr:hypothetical protein [Clostridia bacterium]
MKRIVTMFLALMMVAGCMVALPLVADAAETAVWDGGMTKPTGSGRKDDPYIIDSGSDLKWIAKLLYSDQTNGMERLGYDGVCYMPRYYSDEACTTVLAATTNYSTNKYINYEEPLYATVRATTDTSAAVKSVVLDTTKTMAWNEKVYLKQVCNIDLNGKDLEPIGDYWSGVTGTAKGSFFCGEYDGQGYTISNGRIYGQSSNGNWPEAMFGNVLNTTVKNLTFDKVTTGGRGGYSAIVAARTMNKVDIAGLSDDMFGECVFENITITNTCVVNGYCENNNDRKDSAAGLIAIADYAVIRNCNVAATIKTTGKAQVVGGIVGRASNVDIFNCTSNVTIIDGANDNTGTWVGGIAGHATYSTHLRDCTSGASVTVNSNAWGELVGGLVGRLDYASTIRN